MLDVMKTPPPVTEPITWHAARTRMPKHGETVLIFLPDEIENDEPVWMGYRDASDDRWCNVEGFPLPMVTWWAEMPQGPTEPKPGQVSTPSQLVEATMDHAVALVSGSDGMPSQVRPHHLQWIVRTLLKQLGLAALGGRTVSIDLANGHHLHIQVKQIAEVPA